MEVGHTKFSPDRGFSLIKKWYNIAFIDCLDGLEFVINDSSAIQHLNSATMTYHPVMRKHVVHFNDWVSYLSQFFKELIGLTSMHHFTFETDKITSTREYADSSLKPVSLDRISVKNKIPFKRIESGGLDKVREKYLYTDVRRFVIDEKIKDHVAPVPSQELSSNTKPPLRKQKSMKK